MKKTLLGPLLTLCLSVSGVNAESTAMPNQIFWDAFYNTGGQKAGEVVTGGTKEALHKAGVKTTTAGIAATAAGGVAGTAVGAIDDGAGVLGSLAGGDPDEAFKKGITAAAGAAVSFVATLGMSGIAAPVVAGTAAGYSTKLVVESFIDRQRIAEVAAITAALSSFRPERIKQRHDAITTAHQEGRTARVLELGAQQEGDVKAFYAAREAAKRLTAALAETRAALDAQKNACETLRETVRQQEETDRKAQTADLARLDKLRQDGMALARAMLLDAQAAALRAAQGDAIRLDARLREKDVTLRREIDAIEARMTARQRAAIRQMDRLLVLQNHLRWNEDSYQLLKAWADGEIAKLDLDPKYLTAAPTPPPAARAGAGCWSRSATSSESNEQLAKVPGYTVSYAGGVGGSATIRFTSQDPSDPKAGQRRADTFTWTEPPQTLVPGATVAMTLALVNTDNTGMYNAHMVARVTRVGCRAGTTFDDDITIGGLEMIWRDKRCNGSPSARTFVVPSPPFQDSATTGRLRILVRTSVYQAWMGTYYDYTWNAAGAAAQPPKPQEQESAKPAADFGGAWNSAWGRIVLQFVGRKATGTFAHKNGTLEGELSVDGKTLTGWWTQAPSRQPPNAAGAFSFRLAPDGRSFSGEWKYGRDGSGGAWNGTR